MESRLRDLPVYLLSRLGKSARRRLADRLAAEGRSLAQMAVLAGIADHGPCPQRELSTRLSIDPSDLVGTLDALEGAGLARRDRDPDDRRRHQVSLTPAGREALTACTGLAGEVAAELFAPLSPAERDTVTALLRRCLPPEVE